MTIADLRKTYNPGTTGEVHAVRGLSLRLSRGDFLTIVGSNAAGKSTLFNLLAGTVTPSSGDIAVNGQSIIRMSEQRRAAFMCRVRQNPDDSVIGSMSLAENMAMAHMRGRRPSLRIGVTKHLRDTFTVMLQPLNLGLDRRLDDPMTLFSGGQKQAVALLMATMTQPEILLLDEHTAALDPRVSEMILALTERLVRESGITTLMVTHNIHHALLFGNRMIMLESGNISFELSNEEKQKTTVESIIQRMSGSHAELEEDINKK